ncbi:MAG: nucleotidyl transferase AbiEii/AbiGii toxin family protein [Niabella sp.]
MSFSEIRESELKEVFSALEDTFNASGVDFYIIGAIARDVWYARGQKTFRGTKDVDFAILVGSYAAYDAVREYLEQHHGFKNSKENAFVVISPTGIQVDILPFGEIAIDDSITLQSEGLSSIKIDGLDEVHQSGTERVELMTGHSFKIATLPSIVLLKLIAFDDRPERRAKDPRDIANIISHYFDLQADFIYENHTDQFADDNDPRSLEEIAATVIGKEIREIAKANQKLHERLCTILDSHIEQAERSPFIRNMVAETKRNVEQCVNWLKYLRESI